jgi:hypothetical protein
MPPALNGAQVEAQRHTCVGDLRCEQRRRVKIGHTPERRRGDVTHPRAGGGGPRHTVGEEAPLAAPHGGPAATNVHLFYQECDIWSSVTFCLMLFNSFNVDILVHLLFTICFVTVCQF